ncbi:MAG: efflux RND transporter permease subunit [Candidatus Hydrogenedentes bacterium]|nr:efflux RND transporter permease subunit [Candidatus Hydrogenedentota bacterium]
MRSRKRISPPGIALARPVTIFMLLVTALCLGVISINRLPIEFLPPMDLPFIICQIPYIGATPEQVEKEVAIPAEGEFRTLSSLERVLTTCDSNGATIRLIFEMGTDMANATADVRDRMERLKLQLPDEIENIFLRRFNLNSMPVMAFSIYGPGDEEELAYLVRTILKPRIMRLDGVADITIFGKPEKEVLIEFDQDALRNRGAGLFQVVSALRQSSINVSAGDIADGGRKFYVRTLGEFTTPEDIGRLIVGSNALRLRDVATVGYRTREVSTDFSIDGRSGTFMLVRKEAEANAIQTCRNVHAELEKLASDPIFRDTKTFMFFDQSDLILSTLGSLKSSAGMGAVLAVIVLFLFLLRMRPTIVVATAIPTSAVFAFIYMYFFGITLNLITMISFILAIGMLIDDSIVVIENIYRHRQLGLDRKQSALIGTEEVILPNFASALTTLAPFVPVFYLDAGIFSTYLRQFAVPIVICQFSSLLIGITFIPLAVSRIKPRREMQIMQFLRRHGFARLLSTDDVIGGQGGTRRWNPFRRLAWWYLVVLGWSLRNRMLVLGIIIVVLGLTWFVPYSNMQMQNEPAVDTRQVEINVRLDQGYDLDKARALFADIRGLVDEQRAELGIKNVFTRCDQYGGDINIYLYTDDDKDEANGLPERPEGMDSPYSTEEAMDILWQRLPRKIPGGELRFRVAEATEQSTRSFALQLRGDDAAMLRVYADQLEKRMVETIPDITEVTTDVERRRSEIQLGVRENMADLHGLTPLGIAQTVDFALRGVRLSYLKQGGREIPVWAQFQEEDRKSKANLENVALIGQGGGQVSLNQLVEFGKADSPQVINRVNGKNVISVTSKFKGQDLGGIMAKLKEILTTFGMAPGYTVEFGDELMNLEENSANFTAMMVLAVILIYVVLGATFESFILPVSILATLPLAAIGSFWYLYISDTPFDVLCMIGFLLLVGIIVKNGIVLIDFIKMERERGVDRYTAVLCAGRDRLRPVLMTASTTILGSLPIGIGSELGGEVSFDGVGKILIGGMVTGTLLTMVIVPVVYTVIDDLRVWFSSYFANLGNLLRIRRAYGARPKESLHPTIH